MVKIIFIGTSQFALPVLEKLVEATNSYQVSAAITVPNKPSGRKKEPTPPPVKLAALKYGLKVFQPEKISSLEKEISQISPDLIVVAAYGQIIPGKILDLPRFKSLNLHPSLLPKYRGPSPIQTAILNGEKTTGTTLMVMDEKMDHGPIIAQEEMEISPNDNYQTLEEKLSQKSAELLIKNLPKYLEGKVKPKIQSEEKATYTKMLSRQDGEINWEKSAREIESMVRAFYPWPGAWTIIEGKRLKILKARVTRREEKAALLTSSGFLLLEIVQPEGKKPMTGEEFFRGRMKLSHRYRS